MKLQPLLREVKKGVGTKWTDYRLIGVTRGGIDEPKEPIGKNPGRYKLVSCGTIVYNPMRVLLGSIGILPPDSAPGIISPDYVVFDTDSEKLNPYWFFSWMKSSKGVEFIRNETRGAVRQRLKLRTLGSLNIQVPEIGEQHRFADRLLITMSALAEVERNLNLQGVELSGLRARFFDTMSGVD